MSGYGQAQTFFGPRANDIWAPPQKWGYTFVILNQSHVHARKEKIVIIKVRSSYTDTGRANSQKKFSSTHNSKKLPILQQQF